ncbi:putative serine/threonine protein kinase [Aulographum hederae CBS 113979]|uniref:Putative serine/threonine protein kinase n=1 Tax=Aulographum hederae CBS 113979 TaxID=1176131 RepID=A0A6G1HA79_9PEZI|nr:putative serine/threonine protein kinase [Aulographum hederae CBS 113979]
MASKSVFSMGQRLTGSRGTYKISKQFSEFVYLASSSQETPVVIKHAAGHWRLGSERDALRRFKNDSRVIRPFLDEIKGPSEPQSIVLEYLADDLRDAGKKQGRLTRQDTKYQGYVHCDIKPRNVLVNYGAGTPNIFSDVKLADLGCVAHQDSKFARAGKMTGTSVFRAPEVHLGEPWGTPSDIWSFGVTILGLIWGHNFHVLEPEVPEAHKNYDVTVVVNQHVIFGPFPDSLAEICSEGTWEDVKLLMSRVPFEWTKPFRWITEREICNEDKAFMLRVMRLDPRDRPTADELLEDEWFAETSERTH